MTTTKNQQQYIISGVVFSFSVVVRNEQLNTTATDVGSAPPNYEQKLKRDTNLK